nr:MAG TPA: holin [Caudoviricetes sp.]
MTELFKTIIPNYGRYCMSTFGALVALLQPTVPFIIICTIAILFDCYTAWSLSRRVKRKYPGANDGKFKSRYAGRVFVTLIKVYALTILAYLVQTFILEGLPIKLANIVAAAVCFWQVWSMLENESSCNDAKWAKIAQRILVDKTERHFDIDLSELKENKEDGES